VEERQLKRTRVEASAHEKASQVEKKLLRILDGPGLTLERV
jgi:hypothetical protein